MENLNEEEFIACYVALTGADGSLARSSYIFLDVAAGREDYPRQAWSPTGIETPDQTTISRPLLTTKVRTLMQPQLAHDYE